jgi:PAS domain S-box-containing protein
MNLRRFPVGAFLAFGLFLVGIALATGVWIEHSWTPATFLAGLAALLVLFLAFSVLRRLTQQMDRSTARLRGLMQAVQDSLVVVDTQCRIVHLNTRTEKLFGYTQDELLGQSIDLLLPEGFGKMLSETGLADPSDPSWKVRGAVRDFIARRKDGSEVPVEINLHPLETDIGMLFTNVIRDITERKRAEQSLRQAAESLRLAEAKFRSIFENAAEGIFQATPEGRFITANPALARMLGYASPQELMETVTDIKKQVFVQPGQRSEIRKLSEQVGVARGFEIQAYRKDGSKIWLMGNQRVVHGEGGRILYYEGNFEDITERKRAEEALRENQRALATLMSNLPGMAYRCVNDRDRTMQFASAGAFELTGYYPDDLVGNHKIAYGQLIHPDDREAVWNEMQAAIRDEKPYQLSYRLRVGGRDRSVWEQGRGVRSFEGGRFALEGFIIDVTERVRAQENLRKSEERFRQLAENIEGVFWMTDRTMCQIFYVSRAYEAIWGRTRESLFKNPLSRLEAVEPKDKERVLAAAKRALEGGYDEEYRIVRPDGSVRWIWDRAFPIVDDTGQVYRLAGIAEDITERQVLAEALRQAQKMEAVGRLAGGIAHDFNNLLTVINGYSEVLLTTLGPQHSSRWCVEATMKAGQRAALLTRQLLAFSRKQVLTPVVLDLNALVTNMKDMVQRLIGEDVNLTTSLTPGVGCVRADSGQVQQILMNLVVNARDAMPKGGQLTLRTANVTLSEADLRAHADVKPGAYALLAVSDTGCGMTEEVKARLFEPFFTTKELGKGTGLGLSTVYGIVKQSSGHINVNSEPGKGSTFEIYLPRADEPVAKEVVDKGPERSLRGQETVLLVEDEELVRVLARTLLQKNGYNVLEARNGKEALELAEQRPGPIQLLVSDVVMPGMNGRELYGRLARVRPEMRVVFMSGYTDSHLYRNGVMEDDWPVVLKPFARDAFLSLVREVLDKKSV